MNDLIILSYAAMRQLARLQRFGTISVNDHVPDAVDAHGVVTTALDPYRELVAAGYVSETHDATAGMYHYALINEVAAPRNAQTQDAAAAFETRMAEYIDNERNDETKGNTQ